MSSKWRESVIKRIKNELKTLSTQANYFVEPTEPIGSEDFYKIKVFFIGPSDSPYEGGKFNLDIYLADNYPFKCPKIIFKTEIFHPNFVTGEELCHCENTCFTMIYDWKPHYLLKDLLDSIYKVLINPIPDFRMCGNSEAIQLFEKNKVEFEEKAKDWTKKFASLNYNNNII